MEDGVEEGLGILHGFGLDFEEKRYLMAVDGQRRIIGEFLWFY